MGRAELDTYGDRVQFTGAGYDFFKACSTRIEGLTRMVVYNFTCDIDARYFVIRRHQSTKAEPLTLCQVEIWGQKVEVNYGRRPVILFST